MITSKRNTRGVESIRIARSSHDADLLYDAVDGHLLYVSLHSLL